MPQKRNSVGCAAILAAAVRAPGLATTMLSAMAQEHERALGGWQAEWATLPELVGLAYRALVQSVFVVDGLEVDAARMARNLAATNGLVFAETVSFALSSRFGRARAVEILGRAIPDVANGEVTLRAALERDSGVIAGFTAREIDALFDVRHHLGAAEQTARRVATTARGSAATATAR